MKKKGPFEWTEEADKAFQDLNRYPTSPPVMVAQRPGEPLVLYLAATPYSASAALVAVRKERRTKATATVRAKAKQSQEGLARTTTAAGGEQPQQENAPGAGEASPSDQALGAPPSQETPRPLEDASYASTLNLVEHPVYFVSTVLRDARAWYPMPQNSSSCY